MIRRTESNASFVQSVRERVIEGSLVGCVVERKNVKTTTYHLRNSSSIRHIDAFYIDHSACSHNGGYIITTTDRRTKAVTGFSRFELTLPPAEEITFIVEEEVFFSNTYSGVGEIKDQLKSRTVGPVISSELRARLDRLIIRDGMIGLLRQVSRNANVSSDDVDALKTSAAEYFSNHEALRASVTVLIDKANQLREFKNDEVTILRKIQLQNNSIETVVQNQKRLRDNLEKLTEHGNSTLVRRYLDDMNRDEDTLIEARKNVLELTEEKEMLRGRAGATENEIRKDAVTLLEDCSDVY